MFNLNCIVSPDAQKDEGITMYVVELLMLFQPPTRTMNMKCEADSDSGYSVEVVGALMLM